MTIRHLRTFVIVFQKESITKASEILHVSQPSVSLAIQELENYYHIRLFDRIGKRLSITEQGKWLYDYALHIVSMFDEMETEVKTWNNKGTLRIGSSITIGNFILPQLIEEFQKRYREVEIKVSVCNTKTIEQYILNETDLAAIQKLRDEKYATWEWNYGRSPSYNLKRERKFPAGLVTAYLQVQAGHIQSVRFFGDFFGNQNLSQLEQAMRHLPLDNQLPVLLARLHPERYMKGIAADEVASLILNE